MATGPRSSSAGAAIAHGEPMDNASYRDETPPSREILPGGAVLLSAPLPGAQSSALGIWVRRGTQDEPAGLGGVCHFLEHIVFKGSARYSALDLAQGFDALGASVDAFTTKDHVGFTLRVLPEYLASAAELLADMTLRPAFDPEMIALEQEIVCEEIQEARDTPEDWLHDAFAARVYGGHPRALPILGTRESVMGLRADLLRGQHAAIFAGPNLVLSLSGPNDPRLAEAVVAAFGPRLWGAEAATAGTAGAPVAPGAGVGDGGTGRADTSPAVAGAGGADQRRLELRSGIVQTYFEIGNLAVSYRHPDWIPLYLLANLLGGGMSSRVFQAVREREGLAYSVYTYSDLGRDTGLVSCAGSCTPSKAARLEEVVRDEYRKLLAEGPGEGELEANRAQMKSQIIFGLEGVMGQMSRAAKNEITHDRFIPVTELVARLDGIDRDVVVRCASAYFHPDHLTVATHRPE